MKYLYEYKRECIELYRQRKCYEKQVTPTSLTESEKEELILLRAENEYIKVKIEVIKKEIALRQEKATQLKKKNHQSSKNSVQCF